MSTVPLHTFSKGERLRKKQDLEALFQSEDSFISYPFRVVFSQATESESLYPAQILISIPKRRIKKAVGRNLIKRRAKEAYRLQKQELYEHLNKKGISIKLGLVYIANKRLLYDEISKAITAIIEELKQKL